MKALLGLFVLLLTAPAFAATAVPKSQQAKMYKALEQAFSRTGKYLGDCEIISTRCDEGGFSTRLTDPDFDEYTEEHWVGAEFSAPEKGLFNYSGIYSEIDKKNGTVSYISKSRSCGQGAPFGQYKCNFFTFTVTISQSTGRVIEVSQERKDLTKPMSKSRIGSCEAK